MERDYQENEFYIDAKKRVKEIKGFYIHLVVYLFVNIALLLARTNFNDVINFNLDFSNLSLAFFWGIGLAAHWAGIFGPGFFLGKEWEEKKIKELMEKDRKKQQHWE